MSVSNYSKHRPYKAQGYGYYSVVVISEQTTIDVGGSTNVRAQ